MHHLGFSRVSYPQLIYPELYISSAEIVKENVFPRFVVGSFTFPKQIFMANKSILHFPSSHLPPFDSTIQSIDQNLDAQQTPIQTKFILFITANKSFSDLFPCD